jgi:hypothetical protein
MQRRVSYFEVEWSRKTANGQVRLFFDDRSFEALEKLSLQEMVLFTNLLRLEKPIHYDPETELLTTEAQPVEDS